MDSAPTYHNEQYLLQQLRAGSEEAFTALYRQYSERLYINILSLVKDELVAEELLQDIFVRIWQKRESIHIEHSLAAYLFRVSRNRVLDLFRTMRRDRQFFERVKTTATESYTHIEELLLKKENAGLLQKAISTLSPQRRKAFELCKLQGLSYEEASQEMGISISTLKDHMAKAREAIREFITNHRGAEASVILFLAWYHS